MESLQDTPWDVVISGTGLYQSLLALALSRSGKNILHVDKRDYYGGPEAAFSLQEAEDWVNDVNNDANFGPFESASIVRPDLPKTDSKLSFSRAYTLALSPQLIYSRPSLLPTLVSSRIYRQLEFLALGSFWVHRDSITPQDESSPGSSALHRVPSSREDVFADEAMSMKSKRSLMKFLRHLQSQDEAPTEEKLDMPFPQFLQSELNLPIELHDPLASLSLGLKPLDQTSASYALPRINRHLQSLGVYGAGFASMLVKWGGGAELAQVGCRACAVGGGVYALKRGIKHLELAHGSSAGDEEKLQIQLSDEETVKSRFLVGSPWDLPPGTVPEEPTVKAKVARSIMIVSSPLETLFPAVSEGGPVPAGTVVVFSGQAVSKGDVEDTPPVHLIIHSSDTGECPTGQSVIYGSTLLPAEEGYSSIESATNRLLASVDHGAQILFNLRYTQVGPLDSSEELSVQTAHSERVFSFPSPCLDLAFDDRMIDRVKRVWKKIVSKDGEEVDEDSFLVFEDREGTADYE